MTFSADHPDAVTPARPAPVRLAPPRPFHRLARSQPGYRWWHPLTTVMVTVVLFFVLMMLAMGATAAVGIFVPGVSATVERALSAESDLGDPVQLAFLLGTVGLLWPAAALGVRWGGRRSAGTLSSVTGRLRWRCFPKPLVLAAGLFVAMNALSLLVPESLRGSGAVTDGGGSSGNVWLLLLVVLALVPVQATAEEYAFRGLLMQGIGSWLRHPAFAILLPVPLFVVGHGYGLVGQIDVAAFAVAAGWITWRTGGLEAAIALHVINNVGALGLGAAGFGDLNATDLPLAALPFSLAFTLAYALIVVRWFPSPAAAPPRRDRYLASA
ncbi:CPBP family intramembrane metalloprotease [Arthrobacter gengyunqii]|uniref:CPBP family intramembrane metalloprotease n=1 Tax=Arthrobacter gengyunqii TaxID=2886940 RepID=A0A9X1LZ51_9MICC|nr:CPBP family intramembrane glutamic endopeptidase [Arthrobacter gengyunqii]MCC3268418.1 CPBP family intramembrane metalloprotease [Arthrobacter gengyunqii]UOY95811.1 CPBP family intramembrane metalloprotease [Arthrobacter gengyunqii]